MTTIAQISLAPVEDSSTFIEKFTGTFHQMFHSLIDGMPNIFLGIIILIFGYLIATILKKVIIKALMSIKFKERCNYVS